MCSVCELAGKEIYCDLNNEHCESLRRFKHKTGNLNVNDTLESFHFVPNNFSEISCILPVFLDNRTVFESYSAMFPHIKDILIKYIDGPPTLQVVANGKLLHFIIVGKYSASMEVMDFIRRISNICESENIKELVIINFESLLVSKQSFEICFTAQHMKCFFVDHKLLYYKMFGQEIDYVNKVRFNPGDIVSQTSELSDSPGKLLNILIDCPHIISQLKEIAEEMHIEENGLKSLWSMNSNQIGTFHERVEPYRPIVFKYPIREGADLQPKGSKASFISPTITPVATEMIEKLLGSNIIERGYCLFAAPTHYIPKTRPELSLKQFIERGGTEVDYVAGMEDTTQPQTCRMVHDFFLANQVVYCDPVHQMSPLNQLKNICYSTKYISQLDVTGCYHSFLIDSL